MSLAFYAFLVAMLVWVAVKIGQAFPVLWHERPRQVHAWRAVWGVLKSASGGQGVREFSVLTLVPMAWALASLVIWLPRVYFWNRRAVRLRVQGSAAVAEEGIGAVAEEGIGAVAEADVSVWPPAPHMS